MGQSRVCEGREFVLEPGMRLLVLTVLLHGCFASHGLDAEGERLEHDESFVGDWDVTAAFGWALIPTTTVYRFTESGEIRVREHFEGSYFEGEAGQWTTVDLSADRPFISCRFGDRWWSAGDRLYIESECAAGTDVLELRPAEIGNAGLSEMVVTGPDDAWGFWEAESTPGWFRRCTDC